MKVQSLGVLLVFLSLVGCALQPHGQKPAEADTEKTHEEPAKAGMPTFIYRPGARVIFQSQLKRLYSADRDDADCCIG
jgi:hypothetical protein